MSPFKTQYKITQEFGVNQAYYKQFGLKGHEGIDLIPTGSDWSVFALEDGVVVKDDDIAGDPRSDAYGRFVTIWHPSLKKATQYCHLASNSASLNQQIKKGQVFGVMGATGNVSGAHLHLNVFEVDGNGVRLNKDNGFLGGVDPLPLLQGGGDMQAELDKLRLERDKNWNLYQEALKEADANRKARDENWNLYQATLKKVEELEKRPTGNAEAEKTLREAKEVLNKLLK